MLYINNNFKQISHQQRKLKGKWQVRMFSTSKTKKQKRAWKESETKKKARRDKTISTQDGMAEAEKQASTKIVCLFIYLLLLYKAVRVEL